MLNNKKEKLQPHKNVFFTAHLVTCHLVITDYTICMNQSFTVRVSTAHPHAAVCGEPDSSV